MKKQTSITFRTALLSWLVTIVTLLIFVTVIIPEQKQAFIENLHSKAHGVAVSLRDVAAGAVVNADFGTVVDHCMQILQGDASLDYIVITRNDGFSLIHERTGWRQEDQLPERWHPRNRLSGGGIDVVPLFDRRVFHYAYPFDYSGIEWGWIHVGLSLDSFDRSVSAVYWRTGFLSILFMLLSFAASVLYAKQLVKPILNLQSVVRQIADGNLSVRASIEGGDELASLSGSVNTMTHALLKRDKSLQTIRFAAQRFLSTMNWEGVIDEVLKMIGEAASVSRVYVFENHWDEQRRLLHSLRYEWVSAGTFPQLGNPRMQALAWYDTGWDRWANQFKRGELISACVRDLDPVVRVELEAQDIQSILVSPIYIDNAWWGILGFDDCGDERRWTDAEQDSLQAIADMLGAAIGKQQTQAALLHAKEAAEAASRAKSQFLANMSHEIRTPMNGVLGMIDILLHTPLSDQQLHFARTARGSGKALLALIDDVLDLSKIEAGKLELEQISFDPHQTVEEVIELLAGQAGQKALQLTYSVAPDVPRCVSGDPGRLRQVLLNMVSNAVKFTESGGVAVRLFWTAEEKEFVRFCFEVQDTGVGIPVEVQASIFEPFIQADGSTTRKYGGTGLGLAITRQLVEMMGGEVGVTSTAGKGSTFWFTLVARKTVPSGQAEKAPVESPGIRKVGTPATCCPIDEKMTANQAYYARVLVAEDNLTNQQVVAGMLNILDCKADVVANGREALTALSQHSYDLILMDCQMPDMDGFEATRAIRQKEATAPGMPRAVIIALTANVMAGDRERCLAEGMDDYLGKPFTVDQLRHRLERWLPGKASATTMSREITTASPSPRHSEAPVDSPEIESGAGTALPEVCAAEKKSGFDGLVLVVDDNPVIQEVTEQMLKRFGCQVDMVANGRQALISMARRAYDLVFMDCQMPEMDGYEATRAIRGAKVAFLSSSRVPVIAMTGGGAMNCREKCFAAGMDDLLEKPFNLAQLQNTLERWLFKRPPAGNSLPVHTGKEAAAGLMSAASELRATASAAVSSNVACLNREALDSLRRLESLGAKNLLSGLIDTYLTDSPLMLERLCNAVEHRDIESAHRVAHSLKSSSAYLGATRLAALCFEMETMMGKEALDPVKEMLPAVLEAFERVREALLREI